MGNCLKTQLKGSVNLEEPMYFGYARVYVQNVNNSTDAIKCFTPSGRIDKFPVGSFIDGEGVFSTGKKIVEQGDNALIPANSAFEVLIPKYVNFIVPEGVPADAEYARLSNMVYNIDDFAFDLTAGNIDTEGTGTLIFNPTTDGHHFSGNFEKLIPYIGSTTDCLNINDSNIELDIVDTDLYKHGVLRCQHVFINAAKVTGNLEQFISKWIQFRKTDALATTGDKRIAIYHSGITSDYFNPNQDSSLLIHFNGTSSITITQGSITVNYNINTDTFSV